MCKFQINSDKIALDILNEGLNWHFYEVEFTNYRSFILSIEMCSFCVSQLAYPWKSVMLLCGYVLLGTEQRELTVQIRTLISRGQSLLS